ncbi:MAG: hypothetical protein Q4G35_03215 [Propionibacteriaceae bacterium]|nr:hypothetical protein [Propionibacteriaceae bacterium]
MPERRFYAWHQPPRFRDRAYAHPGTTAISAAGLIVGAGLIVDTVGIASGNDAVEALPDWLKTWVGAFLILGGTLALTGLLHSWTDLARGWRIESLGWVLQLGAWGTLTALLAYLVPDATIAWPLTLAAAVTAVLRMRALVHIEREGRRLIAEHGEGCHERLA